MKQLTSLEAKTLTDTRSAAVILRYLSFWQTKAKTRSKQDPTGRPWIIQTADEFVEKGVLYSKPTIYRTLRKLRDAGLIELEKHWHPYNKKGQVPITASWIRVADDLDERLAKTELSKKDNSEWVKKSNQTDQNDHSLYTGVLTGDLTGDHKQTAYAAVISSYLDNQNGLEKRAGFCSQKCSLIEYLSGEDTRPKRNNPLKTLDVCFEFLASSLRHYPNHRPDPFESQAKVFAKSFLKTCQISKLKDPEIVNLIDYAVTHWDEFKSWKKSKAGSGIKAEYANLKDLMRFTEQLIAYSNEEMAPEPKEAGHWTEDGMFIPEGWGEQ